MHGFCPSKIICQEMRDGHDLPTPTIFVPKGECSFHKECTGRQASSSLHQPRQYDESTHHVSRFATRHTVQSREYDGPRGVSRDIRAHVGNTRSPRDCVRLPQLWCFKQDYSVHGRDCQLVCIDTRTIFFLSKSMYF
jgi:hypothetical protein